MGTHPGTMAANVPCGTCYCPYSGSEMLGMSRGLQYKETFSFAVLWKGKHNQTHPTASWWRGKPSSYSLSEGNIEHASFSGLIISHTPLAMKCFSTHGKSTTILDHGQFHKNILSCSSCCHRKHYFIQQNDLENSSAQLSGIGELNISMVKRWTFVHRTL